jgi:hypothetical protein
MVGIAAYILSVVMLIVVHPGCRVFYCYAECHYAVFHTECRFFIVMLRVIMLSFKLSVEFYIVVLIVIMLNIAYAGCVVSFIDTDLETIAIKYNNNIKLLMVLLVHKLGDHF